MIVFFIINQLLHFVYMISVRLKISLVIESISLDKLRYEPKKFSFKMSSLNWTHISNKMTNNIHQTFLLYSYIS